MECCEVRLKLDEYLRGRLDEYLTNQIKYHLSGCPQCTEELNSLIEINDILSFEGLACPGEGFTLSVMDMIDKDNAKRKNFIFNKLPVFNLGVSLVLTGLLTIFINTPFANGLITNFASRMQYDAASINTNINMTTSSIEMYVRNIINVGGK